MLLGGEAGCFEASENGGGGGHPKEAELGSSQLA